MVDARIMRHDCENSLNSLLKNIFAGMGTILVIAPAASAARLDIDDYMHHSASEALHSDWSKVGNDLHDSATTVKEQQKRVEQNT